MSRLRPESLLPHAVLLALVGGVVWLALGAELRYERLMREDGWAEWATFLVFLLAGVIALREARHVDRGGLARLALAGLALFSIFVAGEEISWGQRLIGYRPPDLFLEKNYQQELNLHNFLKNIFDTRWMVFTVAVGYGIALALLAWRLPRIAPLAPALVWSPWFAVVAYLEWEYPFHLTGEFAELVLGVVFLADAVERTARPRSGGNRTRRGAGLRIALVQAGALGAAVFVAPVTEAIVYRNAARHVPLAEHQLGELRAAVIAPGVIQGKLFRKRRVHKRVFTSVQAGYLDLPEGEFFLDPWNQAYWFAFHRTGSRAGRILLYSFGPNRRRDSDIDDLRSTSTPLEEIVRGDDVGVAFRIRAASAKDGSADDGREVDAKNDEGEDRGDAP